MAVLQSSAIKSDICFANMPGPRERKLMNIHTKELKSSVRMNINIEVAKRNLIDYAANLTGQGRSRFVVDAAVQRAENVILDRTVFAVSDASFDALVRALDEPRSERRARALQMLLCRKKRWS